MWMWARTLTQFYEKTLFQRYLDALDMRRKTSHFVIIQDQDESFKMIVSRLKSAKSSEIYGHFYTHRSIFQHVQALFYPESIYCWDKQK
jgi:hypothetical protein